MPRILLLTSDNEGATRLVLTEPVACRCGRMAALAVNRDGRTRCVGCDVEYQRRDDDDCISR